MLKLHGFSSSNFYNIAKLVLLEKRIPFEEALVYSGVGERYRWDYLEMSPLGKIPCLQTEEGFLTETRSIVDYLEHLYPDPALYPADLFSRAKLLELTQFIDLYLDLPARRVIPNMLFKKAPPERVSKEVFADLKKATQGLVKLANFGRDFLIGDRFSAADVWAVIQLPMVQTVIQRVFDEDPFRNVPSLPDYLGRMESRATVHRIRADQKAIFPSFVAHLRALYPPKQS